MSRHIVVTGASSGIGAAIAREYGRAGARLTLVARREERLRALAAEIGADRCHVVPKDLSVPATAAEWLPAATEVHGPVDVLVNNAGRQLIARTSEVDPADGEHSIMLNVFAPLRLTIAVLPGMLERRSGTIIDIASMAALAPTPFMTYYNASKGALAAASEALRGELRKTGVHVVTVYPGVIDETDMGAQGVAALEDTVAVRLQPRGTAARLAVLIRRADERQRVRVIYPRVNTLARWLPAPTRWLMDRLSPAPSGTERPHG